MVAGSAFLCFPVCVPCLPTLATIHGRLWMHRNDTSNTQAQSCCNYPDEPDDSCVFQPKTPPSEVCRILSILKLWITDFFFFVLISFIYPILGRCTPLTNPPFLSFTFFFFSSVRGRTGHNEDYRRANVEHISLIHVSTWKFMWLLLFAKSPHSSAWLSTCRWKCSPRKTQFYSLQFSEVFFVHCLKLFKKLLNFEIYFNELQS